MLEIKELTIQYGKNAPTVEHFNLSMKKGEIISVVGESPCRRRESNCRGYSVSGRIRIEL